MASEMLLFENDTIGEVFNLEEDSLAAVHLRRLHEGPGRLRRAHPPGG